MNYYLLPNGLLRTNMTPADYAKYGDNLPGESLGSWPSLDDVPITCITFAKGLPVVDQSALDMQIAAEQTAAAIAQLESAMQELLDRTARAKGYDTALSCISYLSELAPWGVEAAAMKSWRSDVRGYYFQRMQAGGRIPAVQEFLADVIENCPAPWDVL